MSVMPLTYTIDQELTSLASPLVTAQAGGNQIHKLVQEPPWQWGMTANGKGVFFGVMKCSGSSDRCTGL